MAMYQGEALEKKRWKTNAFEWFRRLIAERELPPPPLDRRGPCMTLMIRMREDEEMQRSLEIEVEDRMRADDEAPRRRQ